jgi:hypothetical protein
MAVKCAAATFQRVEGGGLVTFTTVVEAGRTYTIRLGSSARAKKNVGGGHSQIAGSLVASSPPALKWKKMVLQIGTNPSTVNADLQDQIDQLSEALRTLEENFFPHGHYYLRRKGHGYDPMEHRTSSPILLD